MESEEQRASSERGTRAASLLGTQRPTLAELAVVVTRSAAADCELARALAACEVRALYLHDDGRAAQTRPEIAIVAGDGERPAIERPSAERPELSECSVLLIRRGRRDAPVPPWVDWVEDAPLDDSRLGRALVLLGELYRARLHSRLSRRALEASVNGVSIADARAGSFPLVHVTAAFERLTGYSRDEVLGRNCRFLQGPATDPEAVAQLRRALREGVEWCAVLANYRKDGTRFLNRLTLLPVHDTTGRLDYVVGIQHDISEVVAARDALLESRTHAERRFRFVESILEGIHSAIVTADADARVTFINRAACALLQKAAEDCVGASVLDVLQLPAELREVFDAAHESHRMTYRLARQDGTEPMIGLSVSRAEHDHHGALGGTRYVIFRDLGAVHHAEVERSRVERLAALGSMVSGFAHEVRNPIAGIRLLVEAMQVGAAPDDPHNDDLERIVRQLDRIERLIRTALQFGRPERPSRKAHDPTAVAASALEALAPRLKGQRIRTQSAHDLPPIYVDDAQLVQVLVILLTNALEAAASPDGVELRMAAEVSAASRSVRFDVGDDGPGIPEALIDRIFDPFFTTKPTGTGLGLSIAQQLVNENRGKLLIASSPGHTTFSVLIPIAS